MAKKSVCYSDDGDVLVRNAGCMAAIPPKELKDINIGYRGFMGLNRYFGSFEGAVFGSQAVVADKLYATPFMVSRDTSPDRIALNLTVGAAGNMRMGIYDDDGTVWPNARLFDSTNIDTTVAAVKSATVTGVSMKKNTLYWLVSIFSVVVSVWMPSEYTSPVCLGFAAADQYISTGAYEAQAFGALPATYPKTPTRTTGKVPAVMVRCQ